MSHMKYVVWILFVAATACACKDHTPEPTCRETVKVIEYKGHRVLQTINGLHLREDFPLSDCQSKPYSKDPFQSYFVSGGLQQYKWRDGRLFDGKEYRALLDAGKWPESTVYPVIELGIGFKEIDTIQSNDQPRDWWFEPAIRHKQYPIDLLPNFGLDVPNPNAGISPVKSKPTTYWAVRGSREFATGRPFVTFCSIKPPAGAAVGDVSYERDIAWLIQGETSTNLYIGNSCRGGISADNGKPIVARIDVPGMALADIDKIYKAASKRLSDMTVE